MLRVSGRILHDTSTLSQRESLKFFASAVQAEHRGEIFSASLKIRKFIGKILLFYNEDFFFLKNGSPSTNYFLCEY